MHITPCKDVEPPERRQPAATNSPQSVKREGILAFDPRIEISADARQIVKHMWILFVLLPFIIGLQLAIVGALN